MHARDEPGEDRFAVNLHVVRVRFVLGAAANGDQHHVTRADRAIANHSCLNLMPGRKGAVVQKYVATQPAMNGS